MEKFTESIYITLDCITDHATTHIHDPQSTKTAHKHINIQRRHIREQHES